MKLRGMSLCGWGSRDKIGMAVCFRYKRDNSSVPEPCQTAPTLLFLCLKMNTNTDILPWSN